MLVMSLYVATHIYSLLYVGHVTVRVENLLLYLYLQLLVLNVRTSDGLTPLLVAAKYNRKNTVLWLLQDGEDLVDVNAVDHKGRNAIHFAVQDTTCEYTITVRTYSQQVPPKP